MKILRTVVAVRRWHSRQSGPVVLVPTMGALHRGHAALIARARRLAGKKGTVLVSIFVNPAQFGPKEDLARYPRPFDEDVRLAQAHGADAIFHPETAELYPPDFSTWVDESLVSLPLCGAARPGHFRGVCTVVLKLFQIAQPEIAIFGRKDFQQCAVIGRMVRDLHLPVRLVLAETVREPDGLALSSRNSYLSPPERQQAPIIRQAFLAARAAFRAGETDPGALQRIVRKQITSASLARIDYVEVFDQASLQSVAAADQRTVLAGAVFFGSTRLIDNIALQ